MQTYSRIHLSRDDTCVRGRYTQRTKDEAVSNFSFVSTKNTIASATALTNYCKYEFTQEMSTVARREDSDCCVRVKKIKKKKSLFKILNSEMRIIRLLEDYLTRIDTLSDVHS